MTLWYLILWMSGEAFWSGMAFETQRECRDMGMGVPPGIRWVCVEWREPGQVG